MNVMQKQKKIVVFTRLDQEDVKKIDRLVTNKDFDNRSSFVRKAVIEYLKELEQKILA